MLCIIFSGIWSSKQNVISLKKKIVILREIFHFTQNLNLKKNSEYRLSEFFNVIRIFYNKRCKEF